MSGEFFSPGIVNRIQRQLHLQLEEALTASAAPQFMVTTGFGPSCALTHPSEQVVTVPADAHRLVVVALGANGSPTLCLFLADKLSATGNPLGHACAKTISICQRHVLFRFTFLAALDMRVLLAHLMDHDGLPVLRRLDAIGLPRLRHLWKDRK